MPQVFVGILDFPTCGRIYLINLIGLYNLSNVPDVDDTRSASISVGCPPFGLFYFNALMVGEIKRNLPVP